MFYYDTVSFSLSSSEHSHYRYVALLLATIVLAINFWGWSLLSPLASQYAVELSLDSFGLALLLALPVLVGSMGRIPVGILTDRFGGKIIFSSLCFLLAIPVILLTFVDSIYGLMLVSVLLGIGGSAFAAGIPFVSSWFPPERRGLALGLYGMGNAGTAISGFLSPQFAELWGRDLLFYIVATLLVVTGFVFFYLAHNAPVWKPGKGSSLLLLRQALAHPVTWDLSLIYVITFGAFVAFAMYLPVLLESAYELKPADAAARAAGFIIMATISRPIGGWLSDRFGGTTVIKLVLLAIIILACIIAFQPILTLITTVAFLSMATVLGAGSGAVIALASQTTDPAKLGGVVGIVGAVGGMGGFLPPILLGLSNQISGSYMPALLLLAVATLAVLLHVSRRFKSYP